MLSNAFDAGDIVYKGEVVAAGPHEPIIDREVFDRVQRARASRTRHPQRLARGVTTRPYLLRGIATCGFPRRCLVPASGELSGVIAEMDGAVKQDAAHVISR